MNTNYVDLLLILLVLLSVARGWQRGFLLGIFDLLRRIASLWLALRFYQPLARWLGPRVTWPAVWDPPIAFVLIAAGLAPLVPDPPLTEVARHHSTDMLGRGYFAH